MVTVLKKATTQQKKIITLGSSSKIASAASDLNRDMFCLLSSKPDKKHQKSPHRDAYVGPLQVQKDDSGENLLYPSLDGSVILGTTSESFSSLLQDNKQRILELISDDISPKDRQLIQQQKREQEKIVAIENTRYLNRLFINMELARSELMGKVLHYTSAKTGKTLEGKVIGLSESRLGNEVIFKPTKGSQFSLGFSKLLAGLSADSLPQELANELEEHADLFLSPTKKILTTKKKPIESPKPKKVISLKNHSQAIDLTLSS